jgi:hypothetical protein
MSSGPEGSGSGVRRITQVELKGLHHKGGQRPQRGGSEVSGARGTPLRVLKRSSGAKCECARRGPAQTHPLVRAVNLGSFVRAVCVGAKRRRLGCCMTRTERRDCAAVVHERAVQGGFTSSGRHRDQLESSQERPGWMAVEAREATGAVLAGPRRWRQRGDSGSGDDGRVRVALAPQEARPPSGRGVDRGHRSQHAAALGGRCCVRGA